MITKVKYAMILLIVFTLLPIQVKAEEPEENIGQVVNESIEETQKEKVTDAKDERLIDDKLDQQEKEDDKSDQQEDEDDKSDQQEDEAAIKKTTGTELTVSVVPSPKVDMVESKWKVIKDKKYVLSITITKGSDKG